MGPALVYTHACILLVLPVLFPDMSSDDDAGAEGSGVPPPHKKQKTDVCCFTEVLVLFKNNPPPPPHRKASCVGRELPWEGEFASGERQLSPEVPLVGP